MKEIINYYKGLNSKQKKAWKRIFDVPKTEKVETLKEYIERTGCRTEERTSKKGTVLIKVYFENGKIAEYEKAHIDTTKAY